MKKILAIILVSLSVAGYSQSKFKPASAFGENFCSEPDIVVHSDFVNKFSSPNLRFIRIQNTLSSTWTAAYCDCEMCHDIKTDTADFYIKVGDSCVTSAHFYPADKKGLGVMQIKVFDPANPSVFVIGEYRAGCWGASAVFLENDQLKLYPNPTTSKVNVQFGSGEAYTLSVVSADGKVVMQQKISGVNHDVDVSMLDAGLYSIMIESAGKVVTSRFIKN